MPEIGFAPALFEQLPERAVFLDEAIHEAGVFSADGQHLEGGFES